VNKDAPERVERSHGHERDWLLACRGGKPAWANFDYSGPLTEFNMLGNVATPFAAPQLRVFNARAGGKGSIYALSTGVAIISQSWQIHQEIEKTYPRLLKRVQPRVGRAVRPPGGRKLTPQQALAKKIDVDFIETTMQSVMEFLAEEHKVNIRINRAALEDYGIDPEVPVTLSVKSVPLGSVLALLLEPLELTYLPTRTEIEITTPMDLEDRLTPVSYRVLDIVPPQKPANLFNAIGGTVGYGMWESQGGPGTLAPGARGTMDVRQTYHVHREIQEVLAALRAAR
jgi:hypothetical protein